ncbi:hypothetical protein ABZZ17_39090 [Streptomyces sp. NPDC006512]|uniref:hypothetical protein n=1 Tax=Streptomyces sp. NPDC006512 TaxID=3154307 RepID=UPI0033AC45BA
MVVERERAAAGETRIRDAGATGAEALALVADADSALANGFGTIPGPAPIGCGPLDRTRASRGKPRVMVPSAVEGR